MKEYKDVQRHLLPVFRAFVDFCNRNQLTYYAAYGTVIGAVRHKGFIPWDDDIDVWMPRRDYERFLSLRDKLISTHYEIIDIEDKGYYLYFAKFCDRRSTIIEREGQSIMGLYIDVFPLDYYDDKGGRQLKKVNNIFWKLWICYDHGNRTYCMHEIFNHLRKRELYALRKVLIDYTLRLFRIPLRYGINRITNKLRAVPFSDKMWSYSIIASESIVYDACWFGKGKRVPFEDMEIVIPSNYDKILKSIYGDYMTLPPEENRVTHHLRYFMDLDRRLTRKQVMRIMYRKKKKE